MSALSIGLSALSADQQVIDVIGQNISNASTPGYDQQVASLSAITTGGLVGDGVQVQQVTRMVDSLLDTAVNNNNSDTQFSTAALNVLQQIQSSLGSGPGSLSDLLDQFYSQATQLAAEPDSTAQRSVFLNAASSLTSELNSLSNDVTTQSQSIDAQGQQLVQQINSLAPQIAQLNGAIQQNEIQGNSPNDLLDQRDQLISQLAGIVNVQTVNQPNGVVNVVAAGEPVVVGTASSQLQYTVDANGNAALTPQGGQGTPLDVSGGQLGGLLQVRNGDLPALNTQLNTLAAQLIQSIDDIQATGQGLNGPQSQLDGTRAVSSATVPLAQAGLAFPPQAGSLFVTTTNLSTGQQTLTQVNIDPATQSLQDVATALSAVPNLQATVNPQTNTLDILAQAGYGVDFAGQIPAQPPTTAMTGTTVPTLSGTYTGTTNDTYTYTVSGSGTVGVTPGLTLNVQDAAGQTVGTFNIGQGYTAGSPLSSINGVSVALAAGTANQGDSFSTPVVAQPDSANLLTALGINTFFTGADASDIAVNPDLLANPNLLSASQTGQPGDASNLTRLTATANAPLLSSGTQTFSQFVAGIVGQVGARVQGVTQQQSAQQALGQSLQTQQQSVEGVDPNEQLVNLLQFQNAFQMASKYVSVVDQNMNTLLSIVGS